MNTTPPFLIGFVADKGWTCQYKLEPPPTGCDNEHGNTDKLEVAKKKIIFGIIIFMNLEKKTK
jgi:hypothetical protein